jgi:type IV fimbrial biogenesis protein FimT
MEKYRHAKGNVALQHGFTLTELLVTMATLVILVGIGAPQLQTLMAQRSVSSRADTFAEGIRRARSESIKRGQRVTMCASTNPQATTPICSAASATVDWAQGWFIFVDDGAKTSAYEAGESILQVQQAFSLPGGIKTTARGGQTTISFTPNGMALVSNASFNVSPKLAGDQASATQHNRCVVLSVSGRAQINKGMCTTS